MARSMSGATLGSPVWSFLMTSAMTRERSHRVFNEEVQTANLQDCEVLVGPLHAAVPTIISTLDPHSWRFVTKKKIGDKSDKSGHHKWT